MRYKLVETTFYEHVALHEAGVWVQWEPLQADGTWWYKSAADIINEPSSRACNFILDVPAKFYTRVELDANQPE